MNLTTILKPSCVRLPLENKELHTASIVYDVNESLFVFADLSYERPSCYYELGIAQALNKITFIVARQGTTIHQAEGEIHFYNNLIEYEKLVRQALEKL